MSAATRDEMPRYTLWCDICDRGAEGCLHPVLCHCGDPVAIDTHPAHARDMNLSLAGAYCYECALVRCDAFPGACRG